MNPGRLAKLTRKPRALALAAATAVGITAFAPALGHEVKDLKYGAILFEFYQQKYFDTLVEYDYAAERGGIHGHGSYPQLLKGGVSLSYGLDVQAQDIFSRLIAEHSAEEIQNRAWFYLAKMLYLRGDSHRAATTMANIKGRLPEDIEQEYRYLAALINIKLEYFDEAEIISASFDDDSPYAPYLHFNLGVAQGKLKHYRRAVANLEEAAAFAGDSEALARLADRAHMAMAYLHADQQDFTKAYQQIHQVSASGVFSNRALLGASWASVNSGDYRGALTPLQRLQQRSLAVAEVQEAVLLLPHLYEKLKLPGRAAQGFIAAYDRYQATIDQLRDARKALKNADVLELFVRNMDELLGESDWFGTAPSVSLNALSPFLLELMSDHSFQSVLKDLRDLYAIRNNLESWQRKRDDFDVILRARSSALNIDQRRQQAASLASQRAELQQRHSELAQRAATLAADDRERLQWLLDDIGDELDSAGVMGQQLQTANGVDIAADAYVGTVQRHMTALNTELNKTRQLIAKVEGVMLELVNAELDIHEERLKYYQVQAQLAKVRILDRSLAELEEAPTDEDQTSAAEAQPKAAEAGDKHSRGGPDAA